MSTIDDKLQEILDNADFDSALLNVNIERDIQNNLLDYQVLHVQNLVGSIEKNKIAIDTSDTGCGKTYCALAVCKQLNLNPIIICPKSIISNWKKIAKIFGVEPVFACNYETLRRGKYYTDSQMLNRVKCPYLKFNKKEKKFTWYKIRANHIIIFDEVHVCKKKTTLNGKLLISSLPYNKLLLSATLIDSISSFEIFTYILGWCNNIKKTKNYLLAETHHLKSFNYISSKLYPKYASRISIKELGDKFPQNNIIVDDYDDDNFKLIDEEYNKIKEYYKKLDEKQDKSNKANVLVDISFSRQKIELYKIEIIIDLTYQYIQNNYSIVIFVNFHNTLEMLSNLLDTKCVVHGKQTFEERKDNIKRFQKNIDKIIICNICAGGQSINLHDIHGDHPRVSLIVPSYSSTQLVQALGRIHRAGSKTPATQRIIFCSNTVEEHIAKKLKEKVNNLSNLNDTDLGIF
jgi:superfamily II DNA or RNA helicase